MTGRFFAGNWQIVAAGGGRRYGGLGCRIALNARISESIQGYFRLLRNSGAEWGGVDCGRSDENQILDYLGSRCDGLRSGGGMFLCKGKCDCEEDHHTNADPRMSGLDSPTP